MEDIFEAAGQKYIHIGKEEYEDRDSRLVFRSKCKYEVTYVETAQSVEQFMNVVSECSMLKLINHWNRDKRWRYLLLECRGE